MPGHHRWNDEEGGTPIGHKDCNGKASLVGGRSTPLKNMKVNWDDELPNIWENKKCSKPPTSDEMVKHGQTWLIYGAKSIMAKCIA